MHLLQKISRPPSRRFSKKISSVSRGFTDGNNILHIPLVKHYNDLLEWYSSERGKDEVSYFYVGCVFCIHLGTKYANFQEKIFMKLLGKISKINVLNI